MVGDSHVPVSPPPTEPSPGGRLDSWKEIAAYLRRDVTTVQRWERREGMPVHRHVHDKLGSVYALTTELDAWARSRNLRAIAERAPSTGTVPPPMALPTAARPAPSGRRLGLWALVGMAAILALALAAWQLAPGERDGESPLAGASFLRLTDFGGIEQSAAISGDGKFVALLSDRDGPMDVWVTQVGTGQFHNLTRGAARDLVNPLVRSLDFSLDGTLVTFWARSLDAQHQARIGIWAAPVLGGTLRPYLEGIAEFDWSNDGTRLAYHTPEAGDPLFVRDGAQAEARHIFSAPAGLHAHFPIWSHDQRFIYFVMGIVPDRMDIWRIPAAGGTPRRLTHHDAQVSHPVFLDSRTLLYLARAPDAAGSWLQRLDTERGDSHRVGNGPDRYTSLGASADGTRLVVTLADLKSVLWRLPLSGAPVEWSAAQRIALTTGSGTSPRLAPDYLLYVASKGEGGSIWKLQDGVAGEVWSAPETHIVGAPAIERDGGRIAFAARRNGQTSLHVVNADGTGARVVASPGEWHGTPAWSPDGQALNAAAVVDGLPRLFRVSLDGGSPVRLVEEYAAYPVWSPDGRRLVYSGADIGTTFPLRAITPGGGDPPESLLTLTRGARRVAFLPGGHALVVLRGQMDQKDLWVVDLDMRTERRLIAFPPNFNVRDFDIAPDGSAIVLEQVEERSDIVLIQLPRR